MPIGNIIIIVLQFMGILNAAQFMSTLLTDSLLSKYIYIVQGATSHFR